MAKITWLDVTGIAPELCNNAASDAFLAVANKAVDVDMYDGEDGAITRLVRIVLAAHLATIASPEHNGPVTAESAGGLSRSYAAPMSDDAGLSASSYGRTYRMLLRSSLARLPVLL